jgi:hypothetical protein
MDEEPGAPTYVSSATPSLALNTANLGRLWLAIEDGTVPIDFTIADLQPSFTRLTVLSNLIQRVIPPLAESFPGAVPDAKLDAVERVFAQACEDVRAGSDRPCVWAVVEALRFPAAAGAPLPDRILELCAAFAGAQRGLRRAAATLGQFREWYGAARLRGLGRLHAALEAEVAAAHGLAAQYVALLQRLFPAVAWPAPPDGDGEGDGATTRVRQRLALGILRSILGKQEE